MTTETGRGEEMKAAVATGGMTKEEREASVDLLPETEGGEVALMKTGDMRGPTGEMSIIRDTIGRILTRRSFAVKRIIYNSSNKTFK